MVEGTGVWEGERVRDGEEGDGGKGKGERGGGICCIWLATNYVVVVSCM